MKKYEIILRDLEKKIHEGRYPENELLPSENQLTVLYQTSRATVRQALKILEENGIIQRRHGFGSIVIPRERLMFPISGLTSFKELKDSLNFSSTTEILIFEKITVDKDLSELSFFEEGSQAFHILRRRNIDEQFVILDRDYILASAAPDMTREKERLLYMLTLKIMFILIFHMLKKKSQLILSMMKIKLIWI